jgi:hypothetical protein
MERRGRQPASAHPRVFRVEADIMVGTWTRKRQSAANLLGGSVRGNVVCRTGGVGQNPMVKDTVEVH